MENIDENTVKCCNCMWEGTEDELKSFVDLSDNDNDHDIYYITGCPDCETDEYLTNIE